MEGRDAAGVILIEAVLPDDGVFDAVEVDGRPTLLAIVVEQVLFDEGTGYDPVAAFAGITVEVDIAMASNTRSIDASSNRERRAIFKNWRNSLS